MKHGDRLYINFIKTSNLEWCSSHASWHFSESIRDKKLIWSRNIAAAAKTALEKQGLIINLEHTSKENGFSVFDCYMYVKFLNESDEAIFIMRSLSDGISISWDEYDAYIRHEVISASEGR